MDIPQLRILAIGRDTAILQVLERLINSHDNWIATVVTTDGEALAAFEQQRFPIVFVCAGVSSAEEETLRRCLAEIDPSVIVARHYGGGSGLLENEVRAILDHQGLRITGN
jgi:CheY-like chemotaxis protein